MEKKRESVLSRISIGLKSMELDSLPGRLPGLVIFTGILNGIFTQVLYPAVNPFLGILFALPLMLFSFVIIHKKQAAVFVIAGLAGFIALNINLIFNSKSYTAMLGNKDRGAEIIARISDTSCCGPEIPWLDNPSLLQAEVIEIKLNGASKWVKTFGRTAIRLPKNAPKVFYGDILELKGAFRLPGGVYSSQKFTVNETGTQAFPVQTEPMPGSINFIDYLKAREIDRVFYCKDDVVFKGTRPAIYGPILRIRNLLLEKAAAGVEEIQNRRLLATLLFGCRQGLDWKTKYAFIKSGTVHIFTVSGLHVGILALILFWFLRWVPFRLRHAIVPFIILIYAAATGLHPPASRALLMISMWCFCRAFLLYIPPLNIVFLSASLLLLKNPFYMKDMGFQFSFLVVGFLIASTDNTHEWSQFPGEVLMWIPPAKRHWINVLREKWFKKFSMTLVGCLTAWLASSGICLYYQGIYFPFSIVANFMLIPFVWLLFNLVFCKICISWLAFTVPVAAAALGTVIGIINGIIFFSHKIFESTNAVRPELWSLLLFYAMLVLLVSARKRVIFFVGLAGIAMTIIFWHTSNWFMSPSVTLLRGGSSQTLSAVICVPSTRSATIVNVPSFEAARCMIKLLSEKGIRSIDRIVFTGSKKEYSAGTDVLLSRMNARQIIQLNPRARSRVFKSIIKDTYSKGSSYHHGRKLLDGSCVYNDGVVDIIAKNSTLRIDYNNALLHIKVSAADNEHGMERVSIISQGQPAAVSNFINSSILEMREYVIEQP